MYYRIQTLHGEKLKLVWAIQLRGRRLLGFPHFIGTIHGFVNEFLALPWLRSQGYPIEMIDDEVTLHRRWYKLPYAIRHALKTNHHTEQSLRFINSDFGLAELRWGRGRLGSDTNTYQEMRRACIASAREGYFCHDEMFVWAHDLIDKIPGVTETLRIRFPFLFIDEVQDNSEIQSSLLHRIFMEGEAPVLRQRLGDANQAIFQAAGQTRGADTDRFPIPELRIDLPNSFRFGQSIADLANPLAVEPQNLRGLRILDIDKPHAIFLFDDTSVVHVLERYAAHIVNTLSKDQLQHGSFTAVGAVHRPGTDDKLPRSVGHYWRVYDHEINVNEPRPKSFVQYIAAGRRLAQVTGETHSVVERVADGMLRLARLANPELDLSRTRRRHRFFLGLLREHPQAKVAYLNLIQHLCVERAALTKTGWEENWRESIVEIVQAITGLVELPGVVDDFLAWNDVDKPARDETDHGRFDNIFRYPARDPAVSIRVGSIHSVKGETHMATLVLDTFYRTYHLKALKPWITGKKTGGAGESDSTQSRLKLHYVAMSRPSHLLCLAMREDALTKADIIRTSALGWQVGRVTDTGTEWVER